MGGIGAGRLRWNQQEAHIVERRRWSAVVFRVLVIATVRRKWGELRGTPAYFVRGGVAAMRHGRRRKLDREWRRLGRGQLGLLMQAAHDLLADALLRVREVEGMKGRTSTRYDARTCSRRRRARALDRAIPMRTTEWATIRSGLHQLLFSKGFGNARTTGIAELALTVGLDEGPVRRLGLYAFGWFMGIGDRKIVLPGGWELGLPGEGVQPDRERLPMCTVCPVRRASAAT